jgi:transketolase
MLRIDIRKAVDSIGEIALGSVSNIFSEKLHEWAEKDARVCYVGVDTMDGEFLKKWPDRAFDVGIAEQDELCTATGLALTGMIPIIQAWAPFTPLRNFDQLRTYLCRHNCNAKIIGWTLGLVNCSHGTTHHDLESIALYRTVPNLTILAPFDDHQFRQAFDAAMNIEGPVAVLGAPELYAPGAEGVMDPAIGERAPFEVGKAEWWRHGKDLTIISVGPALRYSMQAAATLEADGVSVGVINMCSIKPLDIAAIEQAASESRAIITVEEQQITGGLGSAVAEVVAERGLAVKFKRMGIPDMFVEDLGDWTYTRQSVNLTAKDVHRQARELLG